MGNSPNFEIARSPALGGVAHGFFGHSCLAHQFGYGGEGYEAEIREARASAAKAILGGGILVAPHQVHSPQALTVSEAWDDSAVGRPEADALVTDKPGLVLGIVTADCAPVLFADKQAGVIGAAHAGWRGAHGGVLENTVDAMIALGARRDSIIAAIGPTIAQVSYEVDGGFRAQFMDDDACFFAEGRAGHWQFDLPGYIGRRLLQCGLELVENLALDTYTLEKSYYSYRRATHRGAPNYGRQISMIALS